MLFTLLTTPSALTDLTLNSALYSVILLIAGGILLLALRRPSPPLTAGICLALMAVLVTIPAGLAAFRGRSRPLSDIGIRLTRIDSPAVPGIQTESAENPGQQALRPAEAISGGVASLSRSGTSPAQKAARRHATAAPAASCHPVGRRLPARSRS